MAVFDLFRGKALNPIDAKDRVSVPADFRAVIQTRHRRTAQRDGFDAMADDPDERRRLGKIVVVAYDKARGCLTGFDNSYVRELHDAIRARHADRDPLERESAIRRDSAVFAGFEDLPWDVNGRIVLPPRLRAKAGIERQAMFVAYSEVFEIWNPQTALASDDEQLAEFAQELLEQRGSAA